jgi:hypothetical protein
MINKDGTDSGFRNVVGKFTLYTVQKPRDQKWTRNCATWQSTHADILETEMRLLYLKMRTGLLRGARRWDWAWMWLVWTDTLQYREALKWSYRIDCMAPSKHFEKRLLTSSCLSVRMKQLDPQLTDFYEIWYLHVLKSVAKIKFSLKSGEISLQIKTFFLILV